MVRCVSGSGGTSCSPAPLSVYWPPLSPGRRPRCTACGWAATQATASCVFTPSCRVCRPTRRRSYSTRPTSHNTCSSSAACSGEAAGTDSRGDNSSRWQRRLVCRPSDCVGRQPTSLSRLCRLIASPYISLCQHQPVSESPRVSVSLSQPVPVPVSVSLRQHHPIV